MSGKDEIPLSIRTPMRNCSREVMGGRLELLKDVLTYPNLVISSGLDLSERPRGLGASEKANSGFVDRWLLPSISAGIEGNTEPSGRPSAWIVLDRGIVRLADRRADCAPQEVAMILGQASIGC
jgi:hypothetical protein